MEIADFRSVEAETVYRALGREKGNSAKPYVVVNMVSSLDGKASVGGTVGQLGSEVDRLLMREIRAGCDAVVYGAGTLRAENVNPRVPPEIERWRKGQGMRAQPLRVVFTSSGQVPWDNLFFRVDGEPPVVFTGAAEDIAQAEQLRIRAFRLGQATADLFEAMAILAGDLSVRSIVVEGGPALNYSLLRAGLIDELLLTVAPKIVGGQQAKSIIEGPELPVEVQPRLELVGVHRYGSELFLRYRTVR